MPDQVDFADFLQRIRSGDAEAASELIRRFESAVRIQVRLRLTDLRMARVLDSMDICQSVMASFFVRAAAGEYDLEHPEQLFRLLVAMAHRKLSYAARKERAQRRGGGRNLESPMDLDTVAAGVEPHQYAAGRELLAEVRRRLDDEERQLAEWRAQGHSWIEIAETLGGTPDAHRKQLTRALNRVSAELHLDEV